MKLEIDKYLNKNLKEIMYYQFGYNDTKILSNSFRLIFTDKKFKSLEIKVEENLFESKEIYDISISKCLDHRRNYQYDWQKSILNKATLKGIAVKKSKPRILNINQRIKNINLIIEKIILQKSNIIFKRKYGLLMNFSSGKNLFFIALDQSGGIVQLIRNIEAPPKKLISKEELASWDKIFPFHLGGNIENISKVVYEVEKCKTR